MKVVPQGTVETRRPEQAKFTGGVWQEEILPAQKPGGMRVHRFFYAPGEHSHWHEHEGEQALYVVAGRGRVKQVGKPGITVSPGDLVHITPGERHWHGAAPGSVFVHLAFTASGGTAWKQVVTKRDYADFEEGELPR